VRETRRAVIARHPLLFVVIVGSALFALSNHVYFGSHEILTYPIPRVLRWVSYQFRSPGRFVWVPTYVLVVFLLHWAFTRFVSWRGFAIVALAAVIQIIDATGDWSWQRATTNGPLGPILDLASWRPLVHAHGAVVILSAVPVRVRRRGSQARSRLVGDPAARIGTRTADQRHVLRARAAKVRGRRTRVGHARPPAHTLYVLLPPAAAVAERFQAHGARCGVFAVRAGVLDRTPPRSTRRSGRTRFRAPPAAISLGYGQKLVAGDVATLDAGWTGAERGGRWTNTSVANLLLHLEGEPAGDRVVEARRAGALCGKRPVQDVDVLLDETPLTTLHFDANANDPTTTRTIAIPDREHLRRSAFTIQFG